MGSTPAGRSFEEVRSGNAKSRWKPYPFTRKAANCNLILPNALSSAESAVACSFANVFAGVPAMDKACFSSGEWRTNAFACSLFNQLCTRAVSWAAFATALFQSGLQSRHCLRGDVEQWDVFFDVSNQPPSHSSVLATVATSRQIAPNDHSGENGRARLTLGLPRLHPELGSSS